MRAMPEVMLYVAVAVIGTVFLLPPMLAGAWGAVLLRMGLLFAGFGGVLLWQAIRQTRDRHNETDGSDDAP